MKGVPFYLYQDPEDRYRKYQRFLRKGNYHGAYRCLEKLLKEFPDDFELLEDILDLCMVHLNDLKLARHWFKVRIKLEPFWLDYAMLSQSEVELGNIAQAKEYLKAAQTLWKTQRHSTPKSKSGKVDFRYLAELIEFKEDELRTQKELSGKNTIAAGIAGEKNVELDRTVAPKIVPTETVRKKRHETKEAKPFQKAEPSESSNTQILPACSYPLAVQFEQSDPTAWDMLDKVSSLQDCRLRVEFAYLGIQKGFDELLCLGTLKGVKHYWYQVETVKKILKYFHGRALLCDEVGLGKTIETGMLIKEYLLRGMIKNVLILTPSSLVSQWKEEMHQKFELEFVTTEDPIFTNDEDHFWQNKLIIASIHSAKTGRNFAGIANQFYDLVVVDEAHHLRNKNTLSYKLVNTIQKRFIFLLTASPVQNELVELFNLITLLKPGQFKTERLFKMEFMKRGDHRKPVNPEKLRELLRDVMIRNTRSAIDLKLPKRFASTFRLEPTLEERNIYETVTTLARNLSGSLSSPMIHLLLREASSSPYAVGATLAKLALDNSQVEPLIEAIQNVHGLAKGKALLELILKNPDEKKVIFTQFVKSMDYIAELLEFHSLPFVTFKGNMPSQEKEEVIKKFQQDIPILVSTESGGEGRNLQFCNTLINFDLPWNPMRIEQRIGRLHRIGQRRDVFIFNLAAQETVEDYILSILDDKINMFEMVIGEMEPILGCLDEDKEFEDIVTEIWLKSSNSDEVKANFEELGGKLIQAKARYLESKELDKDIFEEEYQV